MSVEAAHVADVPNFNHVPRSASLPVISQRVCDGGESTTGRQRVPKFMVVGHRGNGMNLLQTTDLRMKAIKENTIASFNYASRFPIDFIEFDVQVTKDNIPVVFHDNFIVTEDNGMVFQKRVTELTLSDFLSYGPQRISGQESKPLLRKTKDGNTFRWNVEKDDFLCTLQEAFKLVKSSIGFNIELKFDDHVVYDHQCLDEALRAILLVVADFAGARPIIFSSFHPDAALLVRKLQSTYPVFFLTNGGNEIFSDKRRNSLREAIKVCCEGELQGIVSEVRGVLQHPEAVTEIKERNLALLTYGQLNNIPEAVYVQYMMGVNGVIVDLVEEVTQTVEKFLLPVKVDAEGGSETEEERDAWSRPDFSQEELAFLLN